MDIIVDDIMKILDKSSIPPLDKIEVLNRAIELVRLELMHYEMWKREQGRSKLS